MAIGKCLETNVQQVIERHGLLSSNFDKLNQPSLDLQLESSTSAALSKEIAENTHELRGASYNRKLMGEELQELNMKELQELEKLLGSGLKRVRDAKMANQQIQTLELELEQGQSSEPIGDFIHSDPSQDHDSSGTSLKLGLVYSTRFS
ncbi:hypothetical protein ACE6H2_026718 [Prunus campanulata]